MPSDCCARMQAGILAFAGVRAVSAFQIPCVPGDCSACGGRNRTIPAKEDHRKLYECKLFMVDSCPHIRFPGRQAKGLWHS
eukprot:6212362-Pleurochrysis_carterae.AAC.10